MQMPRGLIAVLQAGEEIDQPSATPTGPAAAIRALCMSVSRMTPEYFPGLSAVKRSTIT